MDIGIARILKLSAGAHIKRHEVAKDSPAFHNLKRAIGACGKARDVLITPQQSEGFPTKTLSIPRGNMAAQVG